MPPENKKLESQIPKDQTLSDLVNSAEKQLSKNAITSSPFKNPEEKKYTPNPELKTLRTFQGDMEETIHKNKDSIVSIATAEQKKEHKDALVTLPEKKGSFFLTHGILPLAGSLLIITSIVTLVVIFYTNYTNKVPIPVSPQTTLISSAEKKEVTISNGNMRQDIINSLVQNKNTFNKPAGGTLYIHYKNGFGDLSINDFFQSIAPRAPADLTRSFDGQYMPGIYSLETNEVFIILSTSDYGQTYSGMLRWEESLPNDLTPIFPKISPENLGSSLFQDDAFNNRDVRVLRDKTGHIVFLYGFVDKNTLILTSNEKIFQSISTKYVNSKLVR